MHDLEHTYPPPGVPLPAPPLTGPDRCDARLAELERHVTSQAIRIAALELHLRNLEVVVHRMLNVGEGEHDA